MNIFGVLTLIFIVLKLLGLITWSWWLVTAPTTIPLVLVIGGSLFASLIFFLNHPRR